MSSSLARVLPHILYPLVLFGGCGLAGLALSSGWGEFLTAGVVVGGTLLLLGVLEAFMPYAEEWKPSRRSLLVDIAHFASSGLVGGPVVRLTSVALAAWLGGVLSQRLGGSLWPSDWPLLLQVMLGVVLADLGAYCAHRFMHLSQLGWRIHAVHHTTTRLYALAGGRTHPFNALLTVSLESVPAILLGITPEAFAMLAIVKAINGLLQHSNVDLRPGPLSYLIATCDNHRFHHSFAIDESNTNFGNTTMVWDHVFGSFYLPHRQPSTELGIDGADIPESYLTHLAAPFRLSRYEKAS